MPQSRIEPNFFTEGQDITIDPSTKVYTNKDLKQSKSTIKSGDDVTHLMGNENSLEFKSGEDVTHLMNTDSSTQDDPAFNDWYSKVSKQYGLNSNPEGQFYDYRGAFKEGALPDASGHWPSKFKLPGHPNEFVGGYSTITGEPNRNQKQETDVNKLIEQGWEPETAKQLIDKNTYKGPTTYDEGYNQSLYSGEAFTNGLNNAGRYLKGAILDIPETVGGILKSGYDFGDKFLHDPASAIKSIPKSFAQSMQGIGNAVKYAGSDEGSGNFAEMMGQMTGQPLTIAKSPLLVGGSMELAGKGVKNFGIGMPRLLESRLQRGIERGVGKGAEYVGKNIRNAPKNIRNKINNYLRKPLEGEIVSEDLPNIQDGEIIPTYPKALPTSKVFHYGTEGANPPGKIRTINNKVVTAPEDSPLQEGMTLSPEVETSYRKPVIDENAILKEGQELPSVKRGSTTYSKNHPMKPKVRLNRDGTYTDLETGEVFNSIGKPMAKPTIDRNSPFFKKNRSY